MKAIVYQNYGSPDVLELKEVDKPIPKENEVLIKVYATSVNSWDWDLLTGKPYIYRLMFGLRKPKLKIIGADVAGKVEIVGNKVSKFRPGDEVFGDLCEGNRGCFAEYVCANENALILKPSAMTFEEAASIPHAALLALQGLRYKKQIQQGHKVLINGAGGGVGTFAIQMAKSLGAEVTGVDSKEKFGTMRSLGADHVIDYTQEDFTRNGQRYDMILDVIATRSIFDYKRSLNTDGVFVMIGGYVTRILQVAFVGSFISMSSGKKLGLLVHKPNKDLNDVIELFESGKVRPFIGQVYPLNKTSEALRCLGMGHSHGKVIITT